MNAAVLYARFSKRSHASGVTRSDPRGIRPGAHTVEALGIAAISLAQVALEQVELLGKQLSRSMSRCGSPSTWTSNCSTRSCGRSTVCSARSATARSATERTNLRAAPKQLSQGASVVGTCPFLDHIERSHRVAKSTEAMRAFELVYPPRLPRVPLSLNGAHDFSSLLLPFPTPE
jgi:hypothetical protein